VTDGEYLWADALCINQSDTPEKNHQVPLMRHIYGHSSRVIMWLGDASADSGWPWTFCENGPAPSAVPSTSCAGTTRLFM
jgi:hypothetical protein